MVCKNNKKLNSNVIVRKVLLSIVNYQADLSYIYNNEKKRIKRFHKEETNSSSC